MACKFLFVGGAGLTLTMEGTPKNLLIRAVKKQNAPEKKSTSKNAFLDALKLNQTLQNIL